MLCRVILGSRRIFYLLSKYRIYNVFGVESATRILFFKLEPEDYPVLKTFLVFLNFMPDVVFGINGYDLLSSDIKLDKGTVQCLRSIK